MIKFPNDIFSRIRCRRLNIRPANFSSKPTWDGLDASQLRVPGSRFLRHILTGLDLWNHQFCTLHLQWATHRQHTEFIHLLESVQTKLEGGWDSLVKLIPSPTLILTKENLNLALTPGISWQRNPEQIATWRRKMFQSNSSS